MLRFPILFAALLLILSFTQIAHARDAFEGTTWKVTVTPDEDAKGSGEKAFDDTFVFKGGKFTSEKFKAKGFDAVDYDEDTRRGPLGTVTVNAKSDKNGTAKWTATTTGGQLSGDLVWTKADGSVLNYTFTAEKKE